MKKTRSLWGIFTICLGLCLAFVFAGPGAEQSQAWRGANGYPGEFTGFFQLQEETPLRVSIDWGWERGGLIPVVVSFRDIDVIMQVQAGELAAREKADLEMRLNQLLAGNGYADADVDFAFHIYEHNALRTRMESAESLLVQLQIDPRGLLAIWVGGRPLKTERLHVVFKELDAAGEQGAVSAPKESSELVECVIFGPHVMTRRNFVFMPGRGVIYAAPLLQHDLVNLDISMLPLPGTVEETDIRMRMRDENSWTIWAVKTPGVEREEKNVERNHKGQKDR